MIAHSTCAQACAEIYDPLSNWAHVSLGRVTLGHRRIGDVDLIAGRGSDNPGDWFHDLDALPLEHERLGMVHQGLYAGIDAAYTAMRPWLTAPAIVFTGHSMGADHVTYLAALALLDSLPVRQVTLFGCARAGWLKLSNILMGANDCACTSYRHGADPVPDVPPWPFRHAIELTQIGVAPDPIRINDHRMPTYCAAVDALEGAQGTH